MTKPLRILALLVAFAALTTSAAHAQTSAYAMFSASHYSGLGVGPGTAANQSGGITPLGGTFGLSDTPIHAGPIAVGGDARLMIQNSANSTPYGDKLTGFLVGGRLAANAIALPFRPYAQVEIGAIATNNGTSTSKTTDFGYQFQFGGDFTLVPHLGLRAEYGAGQVDANGGQHHTLQTFSTGLVVRF